VADGARRGRATHAVGRLDPAALDPATPVITVCRFGNRSGKAADWLAAGIVVRDMAEGLLLAWRAAGLLLVREDGTPGTVR
jgi:rhodanese-related sulfurtransferase